MTQIQFDELEVGQVVATKTFSFDRSALVRYAGASGDFNPIHWNDTFAQSVGLEGVIAHGMLTMGSAVAVVEEWIGDQSRILDYQTRFSRPVAVPNPGEAYVEITATVGALDEQAQTARIDLNAVFDGARVLAKAQVVVSLAA